MANACHECTDNFKAGVYIVCFLFLVLALVVATILSVYLVSFCFFFFLPRSGHLTRTSEYKSSSPCWLCSPHQVFLLWEPTFARRVAVPTPDGSCRSLSATYVVLVRMKTCTDR